MDFVSWTQSSAALALGSPKNTPKDFAPWFLLSTHLSSMCVLSVSWHSCSHSHPCVTSGRYLTWILPKGLVWRHNWRLISLIDQRWSPLPKMHWEKQSGQKLVVVLFCSGASLNTENAVAFIKRTFEQVNSVFFHNIFCHNMPCRSDRKIQFLSPRKFCYF